MDIRWLLFLCVFGTALLLSETKDAVDVIIIGAGVSGLSAGRYLLKSTKQKYNITILEARNRTGGRVWTNLDAFPGAVGGDADCGASWIHGGEAWNPIRDFADLFRIVTKETDYDNIWVQQDGDEVSSTNEYDRQYVDYQLMMRDLGTIDISDFGDISIRTVLGKLGYDQKLLDPLFAWFLSDKEEDEGASLDKISVGHDEYRTFYGIDRVFPAGYSQVPTSQQRGGEGDQPLNVLYNQIVKRVVVSNGLVTVSTQSSQFQADRVIVTLPLGVLKNGDVFFEPALSAFKQEAISKIGFGLVGKVFLKFNSVFWDKTKPFFGYVSNDVNQRGFLTKWMNGYYVSGTPTLIGLISGDSAVNAEKMPDDVLRNGAMSIVRKLFGSNVPNPTGFFRTTWLSDPYSRGAYSYFAVGSNASHRAALLRPECPLHFCGEHTEQSYYSTVHGAFISGIRAAKEIDSSPLRCSLPVSSAQLLLSPLWSLLLALSFRLLT